MNNPKITFGEVYLDWFETYKYTVKPSTIRNTVSIFNLHILPLYKDKQIKDIKLKDIQNHLNLWSNKYKLQNKKIIGYMSNVFKHAIRNDIINKNPCNLLIMPKQQSNIKIFDNFLDKNNLKKFLERAENKLDTMWFTFFYLIAFTGMRRGEALALQWSDIDFNSSKININKTISRGINGIYISSPKTSKSIRIISIDQSTMNILKTWKSIGNHNTLNLVFYNSKGSYITLSQPLRKIRKVSDGITPHGLRHTHCCLMFEAGASIAQVQYRLGHSNVKTTLEIYNHLTKLKEKESANLFSDYLFK